MTLLQIQEPITQNNNAEDELVVGIDLGTTNSLIGMVENDKVILFADENKQTLIPSKVTFTENGDLIGVGDNYPSGLTITSIKRILGKNYTELQTNNIIDASFQNLIIDNSKTNEAIALNIGKRKITAIEISSYILSHLKKIAEKHLNQTVNKAVITVPAYFDDNAKNATKQAAQIAGLEVVRLLNEPTAAALAFGIDYKNTGTYLVYDFGGGTFDVSILKINAGVFKVIGVLGDNNLGGDDIDKILKNNGIKFPKQTKEQLSFVDIYQDLSRDEFEKLITPIIDKTINLTTTLLDDLNLTSSNIDGVLLVGGSTRIPLIKRQLSNLFGQHKILASIDPDRAVAIGACYQADNLSRRKNNLLLDVNPLSLGIEMMGGIVDKIIHRNSTIPIAKTKEFTTYTDNQNAMQFHVVQGEREFARDCRSLAHFEVKNIPPLKAGLARVRITFTLDADGLLIITAQEKTSGHKQEIMVRPSFGVNDHQIKNMLLDALKNSKNDIEERLRTEVINKVNHDIDILISDLNNPQITKSTEEKNIIFDNITIVQNLIKNNHPRQQISEAHDQLVKVAENMILGKVNNILQQKVQGKNIDEF